MNENFWDNSFELDKLAELSIKVGVALQPGQDLLITAPLEAVPLVRRLTFHAYKQGCGIVTPLYTDPEVTLEDGLIAVAMGEAAEQSIKQGRLINLEEIIN